MDANNGSERANHRQGLSEGDDVGTPRVSGASESDPWYHWTAAGELDRGLPPTPIEVGRMLGLWLVSCLYCLRGGGYFCLWGVFSFFIRRRLLM